MATNPAVRQFAGDIRLEEIQDDGSYAPVIPDSSDPVGNQPVETDAMTFSYTAGDKTEVKSKRRGAKYQQPIYSETLPGTTTIALTLQEMPPLILARSLFGEGSNATISAGSVTAGVIAAPASFAAPLQLPQRLLLDSPAIVLTNSGGTTTYVAGTDYKVDKRRGQVFFLDGGAITEGQSLKITYGYPDQVNLHVVGGATPTKNYRITGDMEDRISGENGELRVPKVALTTDGDVDWLSTEPIQVKLTGDVIVAAGENAPYYFDLYKAA